MPPSGSVNGTLPTYRGRIHPKALSLLRPKVQSSAEELWQQQVTRPGHCSASRTSPWLWEVWEVAVEGSVGAGALCWVASGTAIVEP